MKEESGKLRDKAAQAIKAVEKLGLLLGKYVREEIESSINTDPNEQPNDDSLLSHDAVFHGKRPKDIAYCPKSR
jgi:hypothetical protein